MNCEVYQSLSYPFVTSGPHLGLAASKGAVGCGPRWLKYLEAMHEMLKGLKGRLGAQHQGFSWLFSIFSMLFIHFQFIFIHFPNYFPIRGRGWDVGGLGSWHARLQLLWSQGFGSAQFGMAGAQTSEVSQIESEKESLLESLKVYRWMRS